MSALAVIPFEQMERMAATVAKSQLFGMRQPEQALALMLLAQAEGIHPMIAVRDYHIIDGKPALKADTMLARFQESGGVVEWHCMTDAKCDATFSHPRSPKPVRIDWTTERAATAGLTGKSNWKAYPRAMLRSRVISEGVRATCPGVVVGKYTPEELLDATPPSEGATLETVTGAPALLSSIAEGHMSAISASPSLDVLKRAYAEAYVAARDAGDAKRLASFVGAYEARKAELQTESAP